MKFLRVVSLGIGVLLAAVALGGCGDEPAKSGGPRARAGSGGSAAGGNSGEGGNTTDGGAGDAGGLEGVGGTGTGAGGEAMDDGGTGPAAGGTGHAGVGGTDGAGGSNGGKGGKGGSGAPANVGGAGEAGEEPSGLPPDPATVAPALPDSTATSISDSTEFLYTGDEPIQTGVEPGTIEARRVAVLRGKVLDRDGAALSAVTISVLDHPELGQTLTRLDGAFDLAVNGGGQLTVRYEKQGLLAAQRQLLTPWRDYVWLPDVVMIAQDSAVTTVDLGLTTMQVARGSEVSDADGARQATILVPAETGAEMVLPDGSRRELTTLNVRATEYTVGDSGPAAMPATLPPNSGYTYAAELSVDEAEEAGATSVVFNQALPVYVENFLGFEVGTPVPSGYYDRDKAQWIAAENGIVLKVLSITDGMAEVDLDGDDLADDPTALAPLGIGDAERTRLAELYEPGQTLWRTTVTHFSSWDSNWGFGPPDDAEAPQPETPETSPVDDPDEECGSIIGCENQTLGESLPVAGTPWRAHYTSGRTPGRLDSSALKIRLTGSSVPASVTGVALEIYVAGKKYTKSFAPAPDLTHTYVFDGKDSYGRETLGSQRALVRVGYSYNGVYSQTSRFGYNGNGAIIGGIPTRREVSLWTEFTALVGKWDARAQGLGGFTLGVQHAYDPSSRALLLGDGGQRRAEALSPAVITTVAGVSDQPIATVDLGTAMGVAVGPDGSVFIAALDSGGGGRVRQLSPDGTIKTVAGAGWAREATLPWCDGMPDGVPATSTRLDWPERVAVGPDGSLFILNRGLIRRVDRDGLITTVAGSGGGFDAACNYLDPSSNDGVPATRAMANFRTVATGPDGSLFVSDTGRQAVRRIGPDGIISTVAGNGTSGFSGDGGPAIAAQLSYAHTLSLAVGHDGALYIGDGVRVRRVGTDGIIDTVAGNGSDGFGGDGGPATLAALAHDLEVAIAPDDSLLILSAYRHIRRVGPDGLIRTVAGNGILTGYMFNDSGSSPLAVKLEANENLAVAPDGSVFFADKGGFGARIRRVGPTMSGFTTGDLMVPSQDAREVYVFNRLGRHLRTLDALTGTAIQQFGYDSGGYLTSVTDGSGNVTTIERAGAEPSAIVAPGGQRTTLTVNSDGWLTKASNPAGEAYTMDYSADGLMQRFSDPLGNVHTFTYDDQGRLVSDENPAGGSTALSRTEQAQGYTVTTSSMLGRAHTYQVERLPAGALRRTVTDSSGMTTVTVTSGNATQQITSPSGGVTALEYGPDPRWGMLAPVPAKVTLTTPGGLTRTLTATRSASLSDPKDLLSLTSLTETFADNGATTTRVYDGATRTFSTLTAAGRTATTSIDALGRATAEQIKGLDPSAFAYDSRGLLDTVTTGSGASERVSGLTHDAAHELTALTNSLGQKTTFGHDAAGRVITRTDPAGGVLRFGYDAAGNATSITPPGRPAHAFAYTPIDLLSAYAPPDLGSGETGTRFVYDSDRELTSVVRPDGESVELGYDAAGRLSTVALGRGTLSYTYDPSTAQLTGVTAPANVDLSYAYDGPFLTGVTWTGPVSGLVATAYNDEFRVATETVGGTSSVGFTYDADGLLSAAGSLSLAWSSDNALLTGTALGGVTDSLGYSSLGELTSYSADYLSSALYSTSFTRDALGRVTRKAETIAGTNGYDYGYDAVGRLRTVSKNGGAATTYTYDGNGNRTGVAGPGGSLSATYDDQDRLLTAGGASYVYTANGELSIKTVGTQTTSFTYDALGNLVTVTLPNGTPIDYLIDGQNRRVGRKVNGTLTQAFLYADQLRPVAELDGASTVVSRFVYAERTNVPAYMLKGGATYRIVADHLGSPRLVVDVATGTIAQRMDYDEFGNVLADTNPGFQPFGFAGGLYDRDTGLTRFGARDYDAETGRWTAKDPKGFAAGSANLYAYAGADPVNLIDPDGLDPQRPDGTVWVKSKDTVVLETPNASANVSTRLQPGAPVTFVGAVPGTPFIRVRLPEPPSAGPNNGGTCHEASGYVHNANLSGVQPDLQVRSDGKATTTTSLASSGAATRM